MPPLLPLLLVLAGQPTPPPAPLTEDPTATPAPPLLETPPEAPTTSKTAPTPAPEPSTVDVFSEQEEHLGVVGAAACAGASAGALAPVAVLATCLGGGLGGIVLLGAVMLLPSTASLAAGVSGEQPVVSAGVGLGAVGGALVGGAAGVAVAYGALSMVPPSSDVVVASSISIGVPATGLIIGAAGGAALGAAVALAGGQALVGEDGGVDD